MQHLVFEFDQEDEMREIARKLWEAHGVTGEMHVQPLPNGRWRLQIHSEKELRESSLAKYAQWRVQGTD